MAVCTWRSLVYEISELLGPLPLKLEEDKQCTRASVDRFFAEGVVSPTERNAVVDVELALRPRTGRQNVVGTQMLSPTTKETSVSVTCSDVLTPSLLSHRVPYVP